MKVLLTGANGQLGRCFQDRLPAGWQILATDSAKLDITDLAQVTAVVSAFKPAVIVNAAAYTAVDKAEGEIELAERINTAGPANLASLAAQHSIRLVHVSTDYVFDGNVNTPYTEESSTNPLSVYGKTKLAGELAVSMAAPDAIIVRTAWIFSEYGNNFLKKMLYLGKELDALSIVDSQRGCPTYAGDIANAIIALLQQQAAGGIYHYAGDKEVSWFEFAQAIFTVALHKAVLSKAPTLTPITATRCHTLARRPAYSTLAVDKIKGLGITLSDWQRALNKTI
ncbi:MAG: dTDP-4-dehydrorhamnose reductase [Candidatus Malihini olakiniferum]